MTYCATAHAAHRFILALALSSLLPSCGNDPDLSPLTGPVEPAPGGAGGAAAEPPPVAGNGGGSVSPEPVVGEGTPLQPGEGAPMQPPGEGAPSAEPPRLPNASGYVWDSVAIGGGGFVSGIITSRARQNLIFARTDVGGAYRWDEAARAWRPLNDWIAENQKGFWGIESLAIDPSEPERVYMLAGIDYFDGGKTAVLASADSGQTFSVHEVTQQFTAHGNGAGRQSGERLAVDPKNGTILFTGTRENGLFRSADRGASWARVAALDVTTTPTGNGIAFVLFDPNAPSTTDRSEVLYVGVSRLAAPNLFVSRDAGQSWNAVGAQPTGFAPQRAAFGAGGTLYITYGNGAGPNGTAANPMDRGAVWKLDAANSTWAEVTPLRGNANRAFGGISVAADGRRIVASTVNTYLRQPWNYGDRIFLSDDGGATWTDLIGANRVQMDPNGSPWIEDQAMHWVGSVEVDPFNPERVFLASGNGIFMTDNIGAPTSTWKFAGKGLEETVPLDAVSLPSGPLVSVIGDYDGFVHDDVRQSSPAGRHEPAMGTTNAVAFAYNQPGRLARVGSALYLSSDGARSWTLVPRPSAATGGRLAFSADGRALLWSAGNAVQRTTNDGAAWVTVTGLNFTAAIAADTVNANKLYAYQPNTGGFFASTDAGASFSMRSQLAQRGSARIGAAPGREGDVWVPLGGGGLSRSTDSGASFQRVAGVEQAAAVGFGAAAPGQSFPAVYIWGSVSGTTGVYRSIDAGASWLRINDDAHEYGGPGNGQFVIGDANVYGRVFMSTAGRGIAYGELATAP